MSERREISIRGRYSQLRLNILGQDGTRQPDPSAQQQARIINCIYLRDNQADSRVIASINKKRAGYAGQDRKKKDIDKGELISADDLVQKLVESKLHCCYCKRPIKIVYSAPRDPMQWTLDRIDNSRGHTNENTVIACMACNLQRGTQEADKFSFGKGLRIRRLE